MILLRIELHSLTVALSALLLLVIVLIVAVIIYGYRNFQLINNARNWKRLIEDKLSYAIFNGIDAIWADQEFIARGKSKNFKKIFTSVLIESDQRFIGEAHKILKDIFYKFNLDEMAFKNLQSNNIYHNVRGIQVMTALDVKEALPYITALLQHKNPYVYSEAQYSVVRFNGFKGLTFLDTLKQPLSLWQQMRLVQAIQLVSVADYDAIAVWLKSENLSVIAFALSLIRKFRIHSLHEQVVSLMQHDAIEIRINSVKTLQTIEQTDTAAILINSYERQEMLVKVQILKFIERSANKNYNNFLKHILENETDIHLQIQTVRLLKLFNEEAYLQQKIQQISVDQSLQKVLQNALAR